MAGATRVCRICGKEFTTCVSRLAESSAFSWRSFACCQEHGVEYIRRVMESRGVKEETPKAVEAPEEAAIAEEVAEKPKRVSKPKKTVKPTEEE